MPPQKVAQLGVPGRVGVNGGVDGTKEVATGTWTVKFGVQEAAAYGQGYAEMRLSTYLPELETVI